MEHLSYMYSHAEFMYALIVATVLQIVERAGSVIGVVCAFNRL